jgi:hypothetical protein
MITSTLEYPMGPGFFIFFTSVDPDPGGGQETFAASTIPEDEKREDIALALSLLIGGNYDI